MVMKLDILSLENNMESFNGQCAEENIWTPRDRVKGEWRIFYTAATEFVFFTKCWQSAQFGDDEMEGPCCKHAGHKKYAWNHV